MGRPLRGCLAGQLVELTIRTQQGRFLLKPSSPGNVSIKGAIGRAQRYTGLKICAVVVLSNHYHLLALPESEEQLMCFTRFLHSNIARQLGRLYGWSGKFWGRRYRAIAISDEPEAQIARLRYLLEHGVKEGLVERPGDWPGVNCVHELVTGGRFLHGMWHERTLEYEVRRSGRALEPLRKRDFQTAETTELTAVPFLADKTPEQRKCFFRDLVRDIERVWRRRRKESGRGVLGRERIEQQDPHDSPEHSKRSRAPLVHAESNEVYQKMIDRYRSFVARYRGAAERLRAGLKADFPEGCFLPPGRFIPYSRAGPI